MNVWYKWVRSPSHVEPCTRKWNLSSAAPACRQAGSAETKTRAVSDRPRLRPSSLLRPRFHSGFGGRAVGYTYHTSSSEAPVIHWSEGGAPVAQWQSSELIPPRFLVRIQAGAPSKTREHGWMRTPERGRENWVFSRGGKY